MNEKQIILDTLGDSFKDILPPAIAPVVKKVRDMSKTIDPELLAEIQERVGIKLAKCGTHREVLEVEVSELAECIGVATELYMKNPIPDFAFQLSTLLQTHKVTLQQLEKMKDPKLILEDIENTIRDMFMVLVKAMAIEIDKTKNEMAKLLPDQRITVDDLFNRMLNAIQPETQSIYDDLQKNLKKVLGIKQANTP